MKRTDIRHPSEEPPTSKQPNNQLRSRLNENTQSVFDMLRCFLTNHVVSFLCQSLEKTRNRAHD